MLHTPVHRISHDYTAFIPGLNVIVGPTVQITFDENIPSHTESYFAELHARDHEKDLTSNNEPKTPADYQKYIGTVHIDDEDGTKYMVTRIASSGGYIVAYRSPLKADGTRNMWEDDTPIHIEDIVGMTNNSQLNSGHGTMLVPVVSKQSVTISADATACAESANKLVGNTANITPSHPIATETRKRKAGPLLSQQTVRDMSGNVPISMPSISDTSKSLNEQVKRIRFDLRDARIRQTRIPLNVHTLGNIGSPQKKVHFTETADQASMIDSTRHSHESTVIQSKIEAQSSVMPSYEPARSKLHASTQVSPTSPAATDTKSQPSPPEASSTFAAFTAMVQNDQFDIDFVPKTYKQAMQSNASCEWQKAVDKELKSISDNNVFSIVDRPPGVKLQTGRFLFKIKYTGQSTIYKARLIAHGYKQITDSDYWETYAPVLSSIATRILLTMCCTYKMKIHQMDIDTAFLIAELEEDIYMDPPVGMDVPDGKVLKLHKCLYGLKQAPRYFNQHLVNTLLNMGFQNVENE